MAVSKQKQKEVSHTRRPEGMGLEDWQRALRRQFGARQKFGLKRTGKERLFSEYQVRNPATGGLYRVAIRGVQAGENYCSCADYDVNTLGTCKHIEFVLARLGRTPRSRTLLERGFRPMYSEVFLRHGARRQVCFRRGSAMPVALERSVRAHFDEECVLKPEALPHVERLLKAASGLGHEVRCYDDALDAVARQRDDSARWAKFDGLYPQGAADAALDGILKVSLYPYQKEGALFAAKAGRCLIADEMGLGKTAQAMAAAELLNRVAGVEKVLVVCPTSLAYQWKEEVAKFSGRDAQVVDGMASRRDALYRTPSFYKILSYGSARRDLAAIKAWAPDLVILDEAQRIKNWKTATAKAIKRLESPYAVVLTGTPLENRLEELHSIVEFVDRHRLGPAFRFLSAHQTLDKDGRVVGYRDLSRIGETLKPVLLRRTQAQVLSQLPPRMEKRFFVPMTLQQGRIHDEGKEAVASMVSKWRRRGFLTEAEQRQLMAALQTMRMVCNSTFLVDGKTEHGTKADEAAAFLGDLLERKDSKAVVFSQWLRTHELLARRLKARGLGHVLFHGGVPGPKRQDLVRAFKQDPSCRVFLSTDAGGTGLNLQNADAVVIMDQPWNPAVLEQRIGRVHRLGQHKSVRVAHFISKGGIEEGMLSLLSFKKSLFSGVLDGGQDRVFMDGGRLKQFMDSVEKATQSVGQGGSYAPEDRDAEGFFLGEAGVESAGRRGGQSGPGSRSGSGAGASASGAEAWADLARAGLGLLKTLEAATRPAGPNSWTAALVEKDPKTGKSYLKLPLPEPELLGRLAMLLGEIAGKKPKS
jgi:hypothetical protein